MTTVMKRFTAIASCPTCIYNHISPHFSFSPHTTNNSSSTTNQKPGSKNLFYTYDADSVIITHKSPTTGAGSPSNIEIRQEPPAFPPKQDTYATAHITIATNHKMQHYGYRFYSPDFGRWLSRDPIGEEGVLVYRKIIEFKARDERISKKAGGLPIQFIPLNSAKNLHMGTGDIQRLKDEKRETEAKSKHLDEQRNLYGFLNNSPLCKVDSHGLKCMLNCFPFYAPWDEDCIVFYCYPIDDGTCPKCECSGPFNLPPASNWWWYDINDPNVGLGPNEVDFDPCNPMAGPGPVA